MNNLKQMLEIDLHNLTHQPIVTAEEACCVCGGQQESALLLELRWVGGVQVAHCMARRTQWSGVHC